MAITDVDGRTVRESVCRLLSRGVRDSEIAAALDMSVSTFSRRKNRSDFPTFGELRKIAERLGVDETILLVDFGYIEVASLSDQLRQRYIAYRKAIDVIKSMRRRPIQAGAAIPGKPIHPSVQKRVPAIRQAKPIRPL
ncbi:helix-turn-helix domain-containing protein [Mycolicibacter kumamotonensis]|uniref:Helix-turn-helix transcriptional regulator n=1 Tax=Mycolicibacter kumamotonensis TaxID=354243 RepID=A0A7K3LGJ3_9MYCO|nr:helix-turn-helix transcriptional regulator [Mycolicibacter kumamotonensis]NDJ91479.1 helix-turn-helix transcriptional regulator [Mycolicibacter kumamotonensis]